MGDLGAGEFGSGPNAARGDAVLNPTPGNGGSQIGAFSSVLDEREALVRVLGDVEFQTHDGTLDPQWHQREAHSAAGVRKSESSAVGSILPAPVEERRDSTARNADEQVHGEPLPRPTGAVVLQWVGEPQRVPEETELVHAHAEIDNDRNGREGDLNEGQDRRWREPQPGAGELRLEVVAPAVRRDRPFNPFSEPDAWETDATSRLGIEPVSDPEISALPRTQTSDALARSIALSDDSNADHAPAAEADDVSRDGAATVVSHGTTETNTARGAGLGAPSSGANDAVEARASRSWGSQAHVEVESGLQPVAVEAEEELTRHRPSNDSDVDTVAVPHAGSAGPGPQAPVSISPEVSASAAKACASDPRDMTPGRNHQIVVSEFGFESEPARGETHEERHDTDHQNAESPLGMAYTGPLSMANSRPNIPQNADSDRSVERSSPVGNTWSSAPEPAGNTLESLKTPENLTDRMELAETVSEPAASQTASLSDNADDSRESGAAERPSQGDSFGTAVAGAATDSITTPEPAPRRRISERMVVAFVVIGLAVLLGWVKHGQKLPPASVSAPSAEGALPTPLSLAVPAGNDGTPLSSADLRGRDSVAPIENVSGASPNPVMPPSTAHASGMADATMSHPQSAGSRTSDAGSAVLSERVQALEGRLAQLEHRGNSDSGQLRQGTGPVAGITSASVGPPIRSGPPNGATSKTVTLTPGPAGSEALRHRRSVPEVPRPHGRSVETSEGGGELAGHVEYLGTFMSGPLRVGEILVDGQLVRVKEGEMIAGRFRIDAVGDMSVTIAGKLFTP